MRILDHKDLCTGRHVCSGASTSVSMVGLEESRYAVLRDVHAIIKKHLCEIEFNSISRFGYARLDVGKSVCRFG